MDVYLHLGTAKTGTSSIQNHLGDHRSVLSAHGILYPNLPGHGRHGRLGLYVRSEEELARMPAWRRGKGRELTPEQFREWFRSKSLLEIADSGATSVIYSDEGLWSASEESLKRLAEFVRLFADRVHVVVYLRRQDDHLISRYQQAVKTGVTLDMAEFVARDRSRLYDYAARLQVIDQVIGPDSIRVRPFERTGFPDGDLLKDFLTVVEASNVTFVQQRQATQRNESLSAQAVEFVRLVNLLRVEQGLERALIDHRPYLSTVAEHLPGPALSASDALLDDVMDRFAQSNAQVAHAYLGREDGVLFREPRKSSGTTIRQRLEPAQAEAVTKLLGWDDSERRLLVELARSQHTR